MQEIAEYFYAHMYPHGPKNLNYFMRITFITSLPKKNLGRDRCMTSGSGAPTSWNVKKDVECIHLPPVFRPHSRLRPASSKSSIALTMPAVVTAFKSMSAPHVFGRPQSNSDPPTSSSARSHPQTPKSSSGHAGTHKVTIGGTSEYHRTASTPGARNIAVPLFSRSEYERRDGCRIGWTPSKVKLAYVQGT